MQFIQCKLLHFRNHVETSNLMELGATGGKDVRVVTGISGFFCCPALPSTQLEPSIFATKQLTAVWLMLRIDAAGIFEPISSVMPERIYWTTVHILGEHERNSLYYCLMTVTVNSFILVSANNSLDQFIFDQYGARFQAKPRLNHTVNRL